MSVPLKLAATRLRKMIDEQERRKLRLDLHALTMTGFSLSEVQDNIARNRLMLQDLKHVLSLVNDGLLSSTESDL